MENEKDKDKEHLTASPKEKGEMKNTSKRGRSEDETSPSLKCGEKVSKISKPTWMIEGMLTALERERDGDG